MRRVFLISLLLLSACKRSGDRELVIFAAGSLRDVFTTLGEQFSQAHPTVKAQFSFAGTQELRTQLEHGAQADVFASADVRHMSALAAQGLVEPPVEFAQNEVVLIVARELADTVKTLEQARSLERLVIAAPEVPLGLYTEEVLRRLAYADELRRHVVSRELSARQVLTRVTLGEAQAGFAYRTDARAANGIGIIELPLEAQVVAHYPIAVVTRAPHRSRALEWVEFIQSRAARDVLTRAGFRAAAP